MNKILDIKNILQEHNTVIHNLMNNQNIILNLEKTALKISHALQQGGTVFWMGNGGSASDAQHMAAELIGRFKKERHALASIALSTDSSVLTSLSNDYSFDIIFERQLEALCKPNDIVIGLSTSGNSPNIIQGMTAAKKKGAYTIGFTGEKSNTVQELADMGFIIPSSITARIQEATTVLCHILCESIEALAIQGDRTKN